MNWFQRYGIPGAYFVALSLAWFVAVYSWPSGDSNFFKELLAATAVTFLPIGYMISILQQFIYLRWKRLGIHLKAKPNEDYRPLCEEQWKVENYKGLLEANDEPTCEIYTALLDLTKSKGTGEQEFFQQWIHERGRC